MLELLNTDQRVIRSVFLALRKHATEHGYFPDISQYNNPSDPAQIADYKAKLEQIKQTKGFYVDFYSESSARNKGTKDAPRIVIFLSRVYDGEIGAPPSQLMSSKAFPGQYRSGALPGKAANIIMAVHLISHNSNHHYVLNSILANVLGQRAYIPLYDPKPEDLPVFYVYQTGFVDLDDPMENLTEKAYMYTAPDIFLGDDITYRDGIKPIKQISVDITPTDDNITVKSEE